MALAGWTKPHGRSLLSGYAHPSSKCFKWRCRCPAVTVKAFQFLSPPKWATWRVWPKKPLELAFWSYWLQRAMPWIPKNRCRRWSNMEIIWQQFHCKQSWPLQASAWEGFPGKLTSPVKSWRSAMDSPRYHGYPWVSMAYVMGDHGY